MKNVFYDINEVDYRGDVNEPEKPKYEGVERDRSFEPDPKPKKKVAKKRPKKKK
tara:strand:- start:19 stop:180 length:162 start_codon:yes stop_codon:yes gene_type:complete